MATNGEKTTGEQRRGRRPGSVMNILDRAGLTPGDTDSGQQDAADQQGATAPAAEQTLPAAAPPATAPAVEQTPPAAEPPAAAPAAKQPAPAAAPPAAAPAAGQTPPAAPQRMDGDAKSTTAVVAAQQSAKEAFIERTLRVYEQKRTGVQNITTSVPDLRLKAELAWVARCGEDATGLRDYSESHQLRAMLLLIQEATAGIDWLQEIEAQPTSFRDSTATLQAIYKKYLRRYLAERQ